MLTLRMLQPGRWSLHSGKSTWEFDVEDDQAGFYGRRADGLVEQIFALIDYEERAALKPSST